MKNTAYLRHNCGKYKVIRSFGVGRSEQELVRLEGYERDFIAWRQGFVGELFSTTGDTLLSNFVSSLCNTQVRVIGPELIFGALYDQIGYNAIDDGLFRHLDISRLFTPGSELKTIDCLERYQSDNVRLILSQNDKRAQELTKTMYQLTYQLPKSKATQTRILNMGCEQRERYGMVFRHIAIR